MNKLTEKQIKNLNLSNRSAYDVKLGTLLNSLIEQIPNEKHFCTSCYTISEKTDSRGNCVACGAPFGGN